MDPNHGAQQGGPFRSQPMNDDPRYYAYPDQQPLEQQPLGQLSHAQQPYPSYYQHTNVFHEFRRHQANGQAASANQFQPSEWNAYPQYQIQMQPQPQYHNSLMGPNAGYSQLQPPTSQYSTFQSQPFSPDLSYGQHGNFDAQSPFVDHSNGGFPEQASQTISPAAVHLQADASTPKHEPPALAPKTKEGDQNLPTARAPPGPSDQDRQRLVREAAQHKWWRPSGTSVRGRAFQTNDSVLLNPTDWVAFSEQLPTVPMSRISYPRRAEEVDLLGFLTPFDTAAARWFHTSANEMRRQIIDTQGDTPWPIQKYPDLAKLLEKLGLSTPASGQAVGTEPIIESEESDEEDESDENDEEPSPLPAVRPTDAEGALRYAIIEAVWARPDEILQTEDMGQRIKKFFEVIHHIRTTYKEAFSKEAAAKKGSNDAERAKAKANLVQPREQYAKVLSWTMEHGHIRVLETLGRQRALLFDLRNLLNDRISNNACDDQMTENIVKLLVAFGSIDPAHVESLRLEKLVTKARDKGNATTKGLAQHVLARFNALKELKAKTEEAAKGEKDDGTMPKKDPVPDPKRAGESGSQKPTKKLPVAAPPRAGPGAAAGRAAPGKLAPPAAKSGMTKAVETKQGTKIGSTSSEAAKPASKTPLLSGLKAASKKPVSELSKAAPRPAEPKAPAKSDSAPAPVPRAAPRAPAFSLAATLANLGKPKEEPAAAKKPVEKRPPETEEEKKKRLRKESRRHLRVSWESDDRLEKVRIFESVDGERITQNANMTRDAASTRDEGRMLKMHKELEVDEEEEYEPPEEMDMGVIDWHEPSSIDLGSLSQQSFKDNVTSFGGEKRVQSGEKLRQEDRERSTLIAIYPSPNEIPPSPKEPIDRYDGGVTPTYPMGEPPEQVRAREKQFSSAAPATTIDVTSILKRLQESGLGLPQTGQQGHQYGPQPYVQSQPYVQPQPYAQPQGYQAQSAHTYGAANYGQPAQPAMTSTPDLEALEAVFARFSEYKPQPPVVQPPSIDPSIQNALNIFKQQQEASKPSALPAYPPTYPATQPAHLQGSTNQGAGTMSVVDILNSLKSSAPANGSFPGQGYVDPQNQQPDAGQYAQQNAGQQFQPQNTGQQAAGGHRKRAHESSDQYEDAKRNKGSKDGLPYNYKTLPCKFFKEGQCYKGDECTFRHD